MTKKKFKYGVIGSGSWATAIIKILSENLQEINWYVRNKNNLDYIYKNHHNPNYLGSVELDIKKIHANNNINEVCNKSDVLIIAVPSEFTNSVLNKISIYILVYFIYIKINYLFLLFEKINILDY